jgi:aminopeptidase N
MGKQVKRLFSQFQPENYQLKIKVDPDKMSFEGSVIIAGKKSGPPSQRLTFHQKDLKILEATIQKHDKKGVAEDLAVDRINTHNSQDEVRLHSSSLIYPGNYTVKLKFSGKITKHMVGLYPCPFKHMGKDKMLLATQFESHHAREVFPCIDEPEAKATFDLSLITPAKQKVLANTPIKKQAKPAGSKDVIETMFETTPVMSTYLLAFVIGEIHGVSAKSKHGVEVSSWATVAQPKSHLEYANKEAVELLDFFTDYFKTPFPLKKLDQVALPDFEVGAMENWGLITFREVLLLADPVNRSVSSEQRVSEVIAHEVSHQWFGNLVTMKWWDDLWLNESFASIVEHLSLSKLHPHWEQWENYVSYDVITCSNRDIYSDVQPVRVAVKHPDEIHALFDGAIVYAKGSRLLKMLFDYIGEDTCRDGLQNYFAKHAYKNTASDNLWQEFSKVSKRDIRKLMTPWLEKSGMPMLKVSAGDKKLSISQERFLLDQEDRKSIWPVPLLADQQLAVDLIEKKTLDIPWTKKDSPVFNINGSGHFVVNYTDKKMKDEIKEKIINQSVSSPSRINLLNDMLLLAQKGEYALAEIVELVAKCDKESRDGVWALLGRTIGFTGTLTEGDETAEAQLRTLKRNLSDYWYTKLGWNDQPGDDINTKLLRQTALSFSVGGESKKAIDESLRRFKKAGSVEALRAEQRAMIAGAEVRFGDNSSIDKLLKEYETSPNPEVQHSIAAALCSTRDPEVGKKLVNWALREDGPVKDQDAPRWFAYLMRNRHTREDAWTWLTSDWDRIFNTFGKSIDHFLVYASSPLTTPKWQKRYKEFFEPKTDAVILSRGIKIALSAIEAKVEWRKREEPLLKKYLSKY